MYECPNCGGNMLFDIKSQQLVCDQCRTEANPYTFKTDDNDGASDSYDVNIFTCPQCGGEIIGTETSAAEFCSFCGASTILTSRISHEKRPDYMLPFTMTKEDCKKAYNNYARRAFFSPKELRNPRHINEFRGIYTPYWVYHEAQNGPVSIPAETVSRSGNYIITRHYSLNFDIDAYYKGLSKDASSSFYDNISESIAPYDVKGMKKFNPAILSGFYADIADVPADTYKAELQKFADEASLDQVKKTKDFRRFTFDKTKTPNLRTTCREVNSAMFPVWFMSCRKNGRIAYATVNGQTGKVCADLPVSGAKYLLFSLIFALPIFLLLNLILTALPSTTLVFSGVFALLSIFIFNRELKEICRRELLTDDLGSYFMKQRRKYAEKNNKPVKATSSMGAVGSTITTAIVLCVFYGISLYISRYFTVFLTVIIALSSIFSNNDTRKMLKENDIHNTFPLGGLTAIIVSFLIIVINPVSDIYYYAGAIISFLGIAATIMQIITKYNVLTTRKLPQFDKKGGDDRA